MHRFISFLFLYSLLISAIFLSHSECKTAHHTPRSQKSVFLVFCNNQQFSFSSATTLPTGIFTVSVFYKLYYRFLLPSEFLFLLHRPFREFSSSTKFDQFSSDIHRIAMQPAAKISSEVLRKHPQLIQNTLQRPSWADATSDNDDIFSPNLSDNSAEQNPVPASPTKRKHSETTSVSVEKMKPLDDPFTPQSSDHFRINLDDVIKISLDEASRISLDASFKVIHVSFKASLRYVYRISLDDTYIMRNGNKNPGKNILAVSNSVTSSAEKSSCVVLSSYGGTDTYVFVSADAGVTCYSVKNPLLVSNSIDAVSTSLCDHFMPQASDHVRINLRATKQTYFVPIVCAVNDAGIDFINRLTDFTYRQA